MSVRTRATTQPSRDGGTGTVGTTAQTPGGVLSQDRVQLRSVIEQAIKVVESLTASTLAVVPSVDEAAEDRVSHDRRKRREGVNADLLPASETEVSVRSSKSSLLQPLAWNVSLLTHLPAHARQVGFLTQAAHIRQLLDVYEREHGLASSSHGADAIPDKTLIALNRRVLDEQCDQHVRLDGSDDPCGGHGGAATGQRVAAQTEASRAKSLAPLAQARAQLTALGRRLAQTSNAADTTSTPASASAAALEFVTPASLARARSATADDSGCEELAVRADGSQAVPVLVDVDASLRDAVLECGAEACDGFGAADQCASSSQGLSVAMCTLVKDLARWIEPYLNLVERVLTRPSLEAVTENDREKLRRMSFDILALQHEQDQATVDGDMKKSENVYLEQVHRLEALEGVFADLEDVLVRYRQQWSDQTRDELAQVRQELAEKLHPVMQSAAARKKALAADQVALSRRCEAVARARATHKITLTQYRTDWAKHYQRNVKEHQAVFEEMQKLEQRMSRLDEEYLFLIRDRLDVVNTEEARVFDERVLSAYASARRTDLAEASQHCEHLWQGLQAYQRGTEASADHLRQYLDSVVDTGVENSTLNLKKARLSQFRQLYLTLGDLSFKKARHAEEVQKKVDFYTLKQEVAMDTFNPKAKTFSRTRQQWETVNNEVHAQLSSLEEEAQRKLKDFEPTERYLIEAGVDYRSPREELEERNAVRHQKLLEYKKLMEDTTLAGTAHARSDDGSDETEPLRITEHAAALEGQPSPDINDAIDRELHAIHTQAPKKSRKR